MNIFWEAENYKNNFSFVHQYGEDVLKLIAVPERGTMSDASERGTMADMPERGTMPDAPERGTMADMSERGTMPDAPERGTMADMSERGTMSDASEPGIAEDVPERSTVSDAQETGALPDRKETCARPLAIDLGCGNGALTARLAEMGFSVLGIDDSEEMLKTAKTLHPDFIFRKGNAVNFELEKKADVIFSNAVFHWIDAAEQEKLAQNLFAQLKDGGQLVCEFGGKGCAEAVHGTLEKLFAKRGRVYPRVFWFPTVGEYASILEKAGFRVEAAFLFDRPTPQKGENGLKNWISMFVKKPFEGIPDTEKESILEEAEAELRDVLYRDGTWYIDYVRIRVRAGKPCINAGV